MSLHPKGECWARLQCRSRKLQPVHHFGEAQYESNLRTLGCTTILDSNVEYYIVHTRSPRMQQHDRHFGEAPCVCRLQKLGCTSFPLPRVEFHILKTLVHRQQHGHHFGEALCARHQLTPGCSTFLPPTGEDHIDHGHYITCNCLSITLQKHCVLSTCRNHKGSGFGSRVDTKW